jgi:hypothetical protein
VDSASAIIRESRVRCEEPVVLSREADRLLVTLAEMGADEPKRPGGAGHDSRRVDDMSLVGVAFEFQRMAEQQRDAAWPMLHGHVWT